MKKKCIFIYVHQGFAIRYLLRTQVLSTLRNSPAQIVILSHNGDEPSFRKAFESDNVIVEKFNNDAFEEYLQSSRLQRLLISMRLYVLNGKYNTDSVDNFHKIFWAGQDAVQSKGVAYSIKKLAWNMVRSSLKHSKSLRKLLITLESKYLCPKFHGELFRKYSPDLMVLTALSGFKYNEFMAREAKSFDVPVCSVVLSWDNTTSLGMAGYHADHVIAWTDSMKKELIELHDIDKDNIFVGGVAHFDHYYNNSAIIDREALFQQLGLDPDKKTIFFATKSPKSCPWQPEIIEELAENIQSGKIKYPAQILVRVHPLTYRSQDGKLFFQDILDKYERVTSKYPFITLNLPSTESNKVDFDLANTELALVASILRHSDIMINMFSTMVLEASIFQLPSINLCLKDKFNVEREKSRFDIMVDYMQNHNQRVVKTGGVKTVFSMDELYSSVNRYLEDPDTDKEGRDTINKNEAGPFHGNAGEMIGNHILRLLGV